MRLSEAHVALQTGDRTRALEAVDAALEIDPEFLAAQALRDRILSAPELESPSAGSAVATPIDTTDPHPVAPTDGLAKFEQRALRRRLDRQLNAAREAIATRRVEAAAAALDEAIGLDPHEPEVAELTVALNNLRRSLSTWQRNARLAAAATFTAMVLSATWLDEQHVLGAWPTAPASSRLLPTALPAFVLSPAADREVSIDTVDTISAGNPAPSVSPPAPVPAALTVAITSLPAPPTPPALPSVQAVDAPMAVSPSIPEAEVTALPTPREDDERLMQEVLHRYRRAYEGLDAEAARAVWPSVNQAALVQAFDELKSQALTFESCDLQSRGEVADAICRGTASYVPKIGSHEPRIERRVWHFTLRRVERDWTIESARVDR